MPQFLAPICNDQLIDVNGNPLVGGQIETYLAGSTTPAQTYTDDSGSVPQSNPIILNSLGYSPNPIWLTGGVLYKFVIKNAAGVVQRTVDDIAGVNDASVSQSEWVDSGLVPTYINPTSFSVPGDQTTVLQVGRRVRTTNTSGLVYSTISNSVFAAGITTVTLANDSTTLDPGLSGVAYGLLAASPLSVPDLPPSKLIGTIPVNKGGTGQTTAPGIESILPINQARVDVASAATVNLTTGAASTDHINITGTTGINLVTVAAGRTIFVRFAGALTLTNNANIVTQSGANIVTAAGDTCILRATAPNVVEVLAYTRGIPQALGDGQAWQSITASRALNTTYTNSTGRTIFVAVAVTGSSVNTANIQVLVNSVIVLDSNIGVNSTADVGDYFFPVPPGQTYRVDLLAGSAVLRTWSELR